MKKEKIAVYPVSMTDIPLVRYFTKAYSDYELSTVSADLGSGLIGRDLSFADNRFPIGYIVKRYSSKLLDNVDCLFITAGRPYDMKHQNSINAIRDALKMHKNVICACQLDHIQVRELSNLARSMSVNFRYLDLYKSSTFPQLSSPYRLFEARIPIFLIAGTTAWDNSFEILLGLTLNLRKKNYRVTSISHEDYSNLFGIHKIAQEYYSDSHDPADLISGLNALIAEFCLHDHPDLILIQAPDTVMRYSEFIHCGYGIKTYMLCQGIRPDYCILGIHSHIDLKEFPQHLAEDLSIRLGVEVVAVHLSNVILDYMETWENNIMEITHCGPDDVLYQLDGKNVSNQIPIFDCLNEDSLSKLSEIIEHLI